MQRHSNPHLANPDNPIFQRESAPVPTADSPGAAAAVQTGNAPLPTTQSPLLNEAVEPSPAAEAEQVASPIAEAGTVYVDSDGKPVGVSDGTEIVPIDLSKGLVHEDGSPASEIEIGDDPDDGSPSAADLDTVAEEQKATEETTAALPAA
jgi:hypothetical protein